MRRPAPKLEALPLRPPPPGVETIARRRALGEAWVMAQFTRSLFLVIALGGALSATACATAEPYQAAFVDPAMRRSYQSLKSGYLNSPRGRQVEARPVADTVVDGAV